MVAQKTSIRYIAYARCVSPDGAEDKLDRQIKAVRGLGDRLGMLCVDEVRLAGVTGWPIVMRDDLRALLTRKQKADDYDVLIMEDFARLTRVGLDEGHELEATFARCGVRIIYVAHEESWPDSLRMGRTDDD